MVYLDMLDDFEDGESLGGQPLARMDRLPHLDWFDLFHIDAFRVRFNSSKFLK